MVKPLTTKELVEECVDVHLALADSAISQARGRATGMDGLSTDQAVQNARLAWSAMQRARLFCFDPDRWVTLYQSADRYTTTQLAGLSWKPSPRGVIHRNADDIHVDNHMMWGMSGKEAEAAGYIRKGKGNAASVTEAGMAAFRRRLREMPEHKREGLEQMLNLSMESEKQGNTRLMAMAAAQIEDAMYEETPEDTEKIISMYEDYGVRWPFPEPLPFDSCFFCFGRRINLVYSPTALHTRVRPQELQQLQVGAVYLLGYLVAWEGGIPFIFTALQFGEGDGKTGVVGYDGRKFTSAVGLIKTYEDGEWTQPMSLDPWILTMLVKSINDHKQIIENYATTLTTRMARKVASKPYKQLLPLPSPFYMVNLKDELIATPPKKHHRPSGRPTEWSHRWDVRGHECVRIERGTMPIPEKEVERLKKREYRIYEGMNLSAEDAGRLLKRGVKAPGPNEWIAVLSYWRDAFVKGPQGAPYVPAARVAS